MTTVSAHTRVRNGRPEHVSQHTRNQATGKAPRHASRTAARVSLGSAGLLALVGVLEIVSATANLAVAVLSVLTVAVLGWGVHRRRARRSVRKATRNAARRVTPGVFRSQVSRSPAQWQAWTDHEERMKRLKWERQDVRRERRRAAAVSVGRAVASGARRVGAKWRTS